MKEALLIVNFGTSVESAQRSIAQVEEALAYVVPGRDVYTAVTSPTIRRILQRRGQESFSLEEMLEKLAPMGYERLIVQPTHLLYGYEYERIRHTLTHGSVRFPQLLLGKPLLADAEDLRALAECLREKFADFPGALVLMGHGTAHPAHMVYPAFQTVLHYCGYEKAYVATVEGWPAIEDVIARLRAAGEREVLLAPMMLVAGDHACNDMAGDEPDSWKSKLEAEGFTVRCHMEGLGVLPEVQTLYCRHLKELIEG